ncbi:MAG: hypothetical protein NZM12_10295 [Steroidobacteraceae bacterium]|nr:hypothetical protein [Steroidobacteraceae bacterium]MDW8259982.1 hypothetical protein [Gammaproteobacteria bacterium]
MIEPEALETWIRTSRRGDRLAYFEGPSLSAAMSDPVLGANAKYVADRAWELAGMPIIRRTACHHVLSVEKKLPPVATIFHQRVSREPPLFRLWLIKI